MTWARSAFHIRNSIWREPAASRRSIREGSGQLEKGASVSERALLYCLNGPAGPVRSAAG